MICRRLKGVCVGGVVWAGVEADARRLGCGTRLSWGVAPDEADNQADTSGSIGVVVRLILWKPGAAGALGASSAKSAPPGDGARKELTLVCGETGRESLRVESFEQGGSGAAVGSSNWEDVRGKHWWDRLRRIVLLW